MTSTWYTLIVNPGYEEYIQKELYLKKQLHIEDIIISRLFVGYVFIKVELELLNLSSFFEIKGTINFLGKKYKIINNKKVLVPEEISKKQITNILETIEKQKNNVMQNINKFKVGDTVRIINGDFSGILGKIVELKKRTIKILPELFKDNKLIKVNIKNIEII